jgi:hypothetical protein
MTEANTTATHSLLTTTQLATELQVTPRTIIAWRAQGLPHIKLSPRCIRHRLDQVLKHISKRQ